MFRRQHNFETDRQRMVARQLRERGIKSERVLEAMGRVSREMFVPEPLKVHAYDDRALPIECAQTISQPFIVALMTEALEIEPTSHILEIGTGSGYQAAILAELAERVTTVERHAELSRQAEVRLGELGYTNIRFRIGDGSVGCTEGGPFDGIIITAASASCPPALLSQLAAGGRLVGPFGASEEQILYCLRKEEDQISQTSLGGCRFVPLISGE